jgi:sialic acid synthase SpsE
VKTANQIKINNHELSGNSPTYFIADIAANHDGELQRAKDLIYLAKEAGADCAKFQHFTANKIVSNLGFEQLGNLNTHQSGWKESVTKIYDHYHTRRDWTEELVATCKEADIEFMTTPYDLEAIDSFVNLVNAYKIGSGDITYRRLIKRVVDTGKPIILATGASDMKETVQAVETILSKTPNLILLQCNTNYTGSVENFNYVNLNVLRTFQKKWPNLITGLSDHTPGHSAVLGAVALGGRVIEKHFTDNNTRIGPDHEFALNPSTWKEMVVRVRELERALGDGIKRVEKNEENTRIVQRRALRLNKNMNVGQIIEACDLIELRPCPIDAITPMDANYVVGMKLTVDKSRDEHLKWNDLNH